MKNNTMQTLDLRIGSIEMAIAERTELIEREKNQIARLIEMRMHQNNAKLLVACAESTKQYTDEIAALTEQLRGFQQIQDMLKEERE